MKISTYIVSEILSDLIEDTMKRHLLCKEKRMKKKMKIIQQNLEEKQLRYELRVYNSSQLKTLLNYTLNPRLVNICIHFDGDISKLYL